MSTEHLLDDVRDINLSYLLLSQRLITADRELAKYRLRIDEEVADLLSQLPISDLIKLAECNQLLCHFSLNTPELTALISGPKNDDMRRVHAAILLSNREIDASADDADDELSGASSKSASASNRGQCSDARPVSN